MALTEIERLLIGYLQTYQIAEHVRVIVFLTLKTEDQKLEMCWFLKENPDTTEDQIMAEAEKISKNNPNEQA